MKTTHSFRPAVETLEARSLPSTLHAASQALHLSGQIQGTWHRQPTLPDTGTLQVFSGNGSIQPLGQVQATGSLRAPGFVATGHTTGSFTLTAGPGSVTVQLVGPKQRGFSQPPASFTYTIVSGTGSFAGASGSGKASFHESAPRMPHCPPGTFCPLFIVAASFTLTFRS